MALAVPNQWGPSGTGSEIEIAALPTPGNWMFAIVAVRLVNDVDPDPALAKIIARTDDTTRSN